MTVLLVCQLVGEVASRVLGVPLPGPVLGLALLFVALVVRGSVDEPVGTVADGLLGNLSLLFVPAGVGVFQYLALLRAELLPIGVALPVSTLLTVVVTGAVLRLLLGTRLARAEP